MSICLQKCLLQHILGIFVVLGDLLRHAEYAAIVMAHQFGKCAGVACLSLCNQVGFIEYRGYG